MKKFLKTLVVGICLFTLLCCALPAAFAAGNTSGSKKEENVYAIGMDAQGGICSTEVTTSTVFTSDATIYAHWIAKAGASTVPQPSTQPAAIQWQKYVGPALVAGALLTTLLVSTMF